MPLNEVPDEATGPDNIEISFRPPVVGRILSERFLIEEDLSDPALAGYYSSYRVKDLKQFCRDAVLNIVNFTPVFEPGPSFRQVCRALALVSQPNLEKMIETGVLFDGRPYSLTEPSAGNRLDTLIRDGQRLELELAARVIEQAAEGLSAAHRKGLLHCDLRPSNLVVSDEPHQFGSLKILHFGAAWPIDVRGDRFVHLPVDSECFSYAAPEAFVRLGHRSTASDVYSLAAIAYRLITGRLPYDDCSGPTEILKRASRGECLPPTELRTDLASESEEILLSGLSFEPAWRPQNIENFAYRLVSSMRPALTVSKIQRHAVPAEPVQIIPVIGAEEGLPELVIPAKAQAFVKAQRRMPAMVSDPAVAWILIFLLLGGAFSIPVGQSLLKGEKAEAAVETVLDSATEDRSKRQLRFWIESRSADGPISISDAISSPPTDAQISLVSDSAGEIYVIGESNDEEGRIAYRLLAQPAENETVPAGKAVRTAPIDLTNDRAFWIVWTGKKFQDLDANLINAVAEKPIEGSTRTLRHFLERNRNLRLERSDHGNETVLNGTGDRLVYRLAVPEK
jgi:hypothetical protein